MNAVLLTGAGFTKSFGGYLASEMWATILNQPEIQRSPTLLKGMLDLENLDYETFYEDIQTSGTQSEKRDFNTAIRSAFNEMEDNIRTQKGTPSPHSCCRVTTRIVQDQSPSFVFTLNQDMFFERFYNHEKMAEAPGLSEHMREFRERLTNPDLPEFSLRLPTAGELEPRKAQLFKKSFGQIAYVKLHGSQGWLSHDGSDAMVMGTQKRARIDKEPLLKWYFSLFEQVIGRPDTRLLIIGYGFGDEHINDCLARAIGNQTTKLYVISPQPPQKFKDQFKVHQGFNRQKPFGDQLWEGLAQYWQGTIADFYYDNVNPPGDLKHRGRALFKSLGLI